MSLAGTLAKTNTEVANSTSKVFRNSESRPGKLGGMMDSVSGIQKNVAGTVVGVGNVVAKAAGALGAGKLASALTGSSKAKYSSAGDSNFVSGLKGFYSQFSRMSTNMVDRIDPLTTFDCEFRFFPNLVGVQNVRKTRTITSRSGTRFQDYNDKYNFEAGAGGGTKFSDIVDYDQTETTTEKYNNSDKVTFLQKLLGKISMKSHLAISKTGQSSSGEWKRLDSTSSAESDSDDGIEIDVSRTSTKDVRMTSQDITADLCVKLGIYIQKLTLPNLRVAGDDKSTTLVGEFPIPGNIVIPDNPTFNMEIVNVEAPVIENVFYPWMRETTLPWWSYEEQPFTTATVTIDFSGHSNAKYVFLGCRPVQIQTM